MGVKLNDTWYSYYGIGWMWKIYTRTCNWKKAGYLSV